MGFIIQIHKYLVLILSIILMSFLFSTCEKARELSPEEAAYVTEIQEWHKRRIDRLTSNTGWLSLAGLYWLNEGENTFGHDPGNDLIFPKSNTTAYIGSIFFEGEIVRTEIREGINVLHDGVSIRSIDMKPDVSGNPTILSLDSLSWYIIKRGEKYPNVPSFK